MKLLLVDDEEYVIESIKRNLDLTETGVSEVYTAFSVQQAKNIMGMVDIDIVISDIVMPGGMGFDFVEWVRKEELKVQVIFLTSYAEFDYARRAIQLNSVDYLLKPIDFEKLKEAVQRAAESVAKEKKIQDLRQESIKWNQNRKILQQDIWKNVLKSGFSEEKFCETAAQRQLPYGPGHYFRLICLMPEIKSNKREMWDTATMESVLGMQKQSRNLQKMRDGSLSVRNEVLFLNEFRAPQTSYENRELDVWKALLSEEKPEELLEQLQKYLDRTEREGMITREFLVALRTDLTQVVYAWLSEREIKAYALFADADMENLHRNSLYGREEMMEYAGVLVRKAVQYRQYINKSDSVTSQVCAYIDAHYREEIHREELGELVFLNTDYLSRIFKKEKGISISNYIIQKRVEEAKKLLTQSTLPINTVSLYVGYSNFSYFTKMFKDNTGYAPLEYRRSFSEK